MDDTLDCDRSIALHNWTLIKVVGRGANLGWVECRHQFRFILTILKRFCKNNDIKDIRIHNYNDHRWQRWNCTDMAQKGFFSEGWQKEIERQSIVLKLINSSKRNWIEMHPFFIFKWWSWGSEPEPETLFRIKIEFRGEGTEFFGRCHIRGSCLHCHKVSWNNQE